MEVRSKTGLNQIIFGVVFILVAFLAYRIILYTESQLLLLLGGVLAVISIALRPVLGLAAYLVIYPLVPAEEAITPLKTAVFGLIILIINTPCGLCRSSDVRRAIGEKTLNDSGCLNFDFDALRSLPQGSSHWLSG